MEVQWNGKKLFTYFNGFLGPIHNNWRTPQWKCSGMGQSCSHISKGSLVQFTIGGCRSGSAVAWEKAAHTFQRVPWSNSQLEDAAVEVQWHGKRLLTYFNGFICPINNNWRTPQWKCSGMGKSCSHISKASLVKLTIGRRRSGSAVAWEKLLTRFKGFLGQVNNWTTPQWKCSGMGKAAHIFQRVPWSS